MHAGFNLDQLTCARSAGGALCSVAEAAAASAQILSDVSIVASSLLMWRVPRRLMWHGLTDSLLTLAAASR